MHEVHLTRPLSFGADDTSIHQCHKSETVIFTTMKFRFHFSLVSKRSYHWKNQEQSSAIVYMPNVIV